MPYLHPPSSWQLPLTLFAYPNSTINVLSSYNITILGTCTLVVAGKLCGVEELVISPQATVAFGDHGSTCEEGPTAGLYNLLSTLVYGTLEGLHSNLQDVSVHGHVCAFQNAVISNVTTPDTSGDGMLVISDFGY